MIDCDSLDYAQARVWARHGQCAGELHWPRLQSAREFTTVLEAARETPLRRWLDGITATASAHAIEAVLRSQWRAAVDEVARWMPGPWQPAVRWCGVLPELPLVEHLAQGHEAPGWMDDDPDYRALAAVPVAQRRTLLSTGRFAPLVGDGAEPGTLAHAWQSHWRRLWPRGQGHAGLEAVAAALREHAAGFTSAGGASHAWLLRRTLQARLSLMLRRAGGEPALAFIHLALTAIELERLRGELLGRALFAPLAHGRTA